MHPRAKNIRAIAGALAAAGYFTMLPLAHADLDPFMVSLDQTVTHDDNLFRAPAGSETPDWQSDTRARLDYDNVIGRSRARAWASADASRYRHSTQLDNENYQLGGQLDWSTIGRLSGQLGFDDDSALYRAGLSGDQAFSGKSMLHTQRGFARLALGSSTPLSFGGGVDVSRSKNSASALSANDINQWVGDLGVTYAQNPDLQVYLRGRRTEGKYPRYLPDPIDFHRDDVIVGGSWHTGGSTSIDAELARTREDYSDSPMRRYWTGFLRGNWQVTGHVAVSASLARDSTQNFMGGVLGQAPGGSSSQGGSGTTIVTQQSLSLNDATDVNVRWDLTSKIEVTGSYLHIVRHYDDVPLGSATLNGTDVTGLYQVGIAYQLSRGIKGGCSATRSTHASGALSAALGPAYLSNAYACFAELVIH